jgi:hypothetical protein
MMVALFLLESRDEAVVAKQQLDDDEAPRRLDTANKTALVPCERETRAQIIVATATK